MAMIKIFYQGEGIVAFEEVVVDEDVTSAILLSSIADERGLQGGDWALFIEDDDDALEAAISLRERGVKHRHRMHVHRCRKIEVRVTYNNDTKPHSFSSGTTVGKVKDYFVEKVFPIIPSRGQKWL